MARAASGVDNEIISLCLAQEIYDLEARRSIFPIVHYNPSIIARDLASEGRIVTNEEEISLRKSISPEDVRCFIAEAISQKPSIIAYGDSSKLHSYDEFLEMLGEGLQIQLATQPALEAHIV